MQYHRNEIDVYISSLAKISTNLTSLNDDTTLAKLSTIKEILEYIKSIYENVETNLHEQLSNTFSSVSIGVFKERGHFVTSNKGLTSKTNNFNVYKHSSFRKGKSIGSYIRNGACIGASASYSLYSLNHSRSNDYAGIKSKVEIGNARVGIDLGASLYSNGALNPNVYGEIEGRVSLLHSSVNGSVGSSKLGLTTNRDLEVGAVYGEAKLKLSSSGVSLKAGAGAHLAKASGSVGFHLFGYYVEVEVGAILGGVSASVEYEQTNDELVVGVEGSLVGGVGVKIKFGKGD